MDEFKNKEMKKIYLEMHGGLGNQLFIFALLFVLLKKDPNAKIYLDKTKFFLRRIHDGFLLNDLINRLNRKLYHSVKYSILPNFFLKFLKFFRTNIDINQENEPYVFQKLEIIKNYVILSGYWQSYKYFFDIQNDLRVFLHQFLNDQNDLDKINDFVSKISQTKIAIHVRRGDYVKLKTYGLLSNDYYSNSIKYFQRLYPRAQYFVFSDDINLVKNEKLFQMPVIYIQPKNISSINSLYLMSQCDHFITANSSFSWWAAFLGNHKDKKVVTPKKWFKDRSDFNDLIPPEWIKIENNLI